MSNPDPFSERYQKKQERARKDKTLESDDDAPIPDAPVARAKATSTPRRNDPCPCGSGKKYKKCCGKSA